MASTSYLVSFYQDLVKTIVPGPQSLSYFIPLSLLISCLVISPDRIGNKQIRWIVLPISLGSTIHAWMCMGGPDVISADTIWWSLFFLFFRDPKRDFKRVTWATDFSDVKSQPADKSHTQSTSSGQLGELVDEGYPKALQDRLNWVFLLLSSRPLTSWKTGDAAHDARVPPPNVARSRKAFAKPVLGILAFSLLVLTPLSLQAHAHDDFFRSAGLPRDSPPGSVELAPFPVRWLYAVLPLKRVRSLVLAAYVYSLMTILFLPPYLLVVLANYLFALPSEAWSPHTWPRPHFGPFSAILDHGLRGFWGRWWHQQMRHAVSEPGRWLAAQFGLRNGGRGEFLRYTMICMSAFALSGITHMGLVPPEPRWAEKHSSWSLRLEIASFFWMQPVGILLEMLIVEPEIILIAAFVDAVFDESHKTSHKRSKRLSRLLRFSWVLIWMDMPLSFLNDPFIELGYWQIWPGLWSIISRGNLR